MDDEGRQARFVALYDAGADRLVTQLFVVTGNRDEARDCVHEAFLRAWARWDELDGAVADAQSWVYTVAYRIAVSRFRRMLTQVRHQRRSPAVEPAYDPPAAEILAVRDALSMLSAPYRAVLVLHYYADLPVTEIAAVLGLSESGVKTRLSRGRAAMAARLGDPRAMGVTS